MKLKIILILITIILFNISILSAQETKDSYSGIWASIGNEQYGDKYYLIIEKIDNKYLIMKIDFEDSGLNFRAIGNIKDKQIELAIPNSTMKYKITLSTEKGKPSLDLEDISPGNTEDILETFVPLSKAELK